ncbi:MAG: bifunctional 5,10-methylenetetrahydrofolate dehydrogenase/5,10-methenyltetrahydrofolate cyclohydrolase [bacterium]
MSQTINGTKLAEEIKDKVAKEIYEMKGLRPNLAIVLIGEREDSVLYVKLKEREAKKVGIDTHLYKCAKNISEQELLEIIDFLNKDDCVDGILVQLPLPEGLDTDKIISAIDSKKDADCFHPKNLETLQTGKDQNRALPPVAGAVLKILADIKYDLKGKTVCVLCNSDIFGKTLSQIFGYRGAKINIVHAQDKNFMAETKGADILITAIGKPRFIKKEMVKKGAVIIDVGIVKEKKKVFGDVDFEDVKNKASYITPVPGGVGPMTIAILFENCLKLYKKRH